jgi:hypothetical protein
MKQQAIQYAALDVHQATPPSGKRVPRNAAQFRKSSGRRIGIATSIAVQPAA